MELKQEDLLNFDLVKNKVNNKKNSLIITLNQYK